MKRERGVYCERVLQDDVAIAYLRGELAEGERDVFEQHYFECSGCFERLQVLRELPAVLRPEGAAPPRPARRPDRSPLEELARVEPPPDAPLVVRGGEGADGTVARALLRYMRGDFAGAVAGLRAAAKEGAGAPETLFYLGVSELLAGRAEAAIGELRRVAGGADPTFTEPARYYLAKAHLARGDVAAARRELQIVARGDGEHKSAAEQLLLALGAEP